MFSEGKCCYCGEECNPASQSCGSCARKYSIRPKSNHK